MAYTIVLDAGHGGSDPGAVYNGRQEKDDSLRLTMAVGDLLTDAGYNVIYTRTTDRYDTPFEKATIGNNNNADLFVSIHRNSGQINNQYDGVQTLVYNDEGLKAELARNINKNLVALGYSDKGVVERPNLVVLKRTKMPSVLIEAGFINSDKDNMLFDEQFNETAAAIADAIEETVGAPDGGNDTAGYSVQTGAYKNRQLAYNQLQQLVAQGFPVFIIYENGLYKVRVGKYNTLDNAIIMEQKLRDFGYNTFIANYN